MDNVSIPTKTEADDLQVNFAVIVGGEWRGEIDRDGDMARYGADNRCR